MLRCLWGRRDALPRPARGIGGARRDRGGGAAGEIPRPVGRLGRSDLYRIRVLSGPYSLLCLPRLRTLRRQGLSPQAQTRGNVPSAGMRAHFFAASSSEVGDTAREFAHSDLSPSEIGRARFRSRGEVKDASHALRGAEVLLEERERAAPGEVGRGLVVALPAGVVVEGVVRARI